MKFVQRLFVDLRLSKLEESGEFCGGEEGLKWEVHFPEKARRPSPPISRWEASYRGKVVTRINWFNSVRLVLMAAIVQGGDR